MLKFEKGLPPYDPTAIVKESIIKTDTITTDRQVITFDLKENGAGRFLKLSKLVRTANNLIKIIIPGDIIQEFGECMLDFLEEARKKNLLGKRDPIIVGEMFVVGEHRYYVDVIKKNKDLHLEIRSVFRKNRQYFTIPANTIGEYINLFHYFDEEFRKFSSQLND